MNLIVAITERKRNGIAVSITELLLVAITFSLIFVVASYIVFNVQGSMASTHRLKVYGDAYLYIIQENNTVYAELKLYSDIKPALVIKNMKINNIESERVTIVSILQGDPYINENGELVLPTGSLVIVRFYFPSSIINEINPQYYGVIEGHIITSDGFLYKVALKIKYS